MGETVAEDLEVSTGAVKAATCYCRGGASLGRL